MVMPAGYQAPTPNSRFQLEQGGPPWTVEGAALSPTCSGYQATKPVVILTFEPREEPWKVEDEMQHQYFSGDFDGAASAVNQLLGNSYLDGICHLEGHEMGM
ncbi:hypothetical protein E5288_WYG021846 [Bos mutus]|uniref:KRAB domain-containing protein n=1 Tax=Bos mutus TaxID=72004 RepID=A0A6B0S7L2_9CETA|nr:hypothetical protein [Bos mutus]